MNTNTDQKMNNEANSSNTLTPQINPQPGRLDLKRMGFAFGTTGVLFYLGCMLTMATVPREKAVVFLNSLLHGLNVEPILQTNVPFGEVVLGLITTFVLGWFAGALVAGFYNLGFRKTK